MLVACLLIAGIATSVGVAVPAAASAPVLVAARSRCNGRTVDGYQGQIRDFDRHGPPGDPAGLQKRFGAINDVLTGLNEERGILDAECPTDATSRGPLFAQLGATVAWGLALQADIAARINAACAPGAQAVPEALLAQAWLSLAHEVNNDNGTVLPSIAEVVPKVQSRAKALGLTLPAFSDTSPYWRDRIRNQANTAVAACEGPPASANPAPPAPSPSASPE